MLSINSGDWFLSKPRVARGCLPWVVSGTHSASHPAAPHSWVLLPPRVLHPPCSLPHIWLAHSFASDSLFLQVCGFHIIWRYAQISLPYRILTSILLLPRPSTTNDLLKTTSTIFLFCIVPFSSFDTSHWVFFLKLMSPIFVFISLFYDYFPTSPNPSCLSPSLTHCSPTWT